MAASCYLVLLLLLAPASRQEEDFEVIGSPGGPRFERLVDGEEASSSSPPPGLCTRGLN